MPVTRETCRAVEEEYQQEPGVVFRWRWWQVQHLRAHLIVFLCQQTVPSFVEALAPAATTGDPPPMVRTIEQLSYRLAQLCPRENDPEHVGDVRLSADERAALRRMGRVLAAWYRGERPSAQRRLALLSLASCRRLLAGPDALTSSKQETRAREATRASMSIQAGR